MKMQQHLKKTMVFLVLASTSLVFLAASCGGSKKDASEPEYELRETAEEVDWENVQLSEEEKAEFEEGQVEYEPVEEGSKEPEETAAVTGTGSGPGTLKLVLKCFGEEVAGDVTVMKSADRSVVDEGSGKSTHVFSLSQGIYDIDAVYHEPIDEPKLSLNKVEIPPGGKVERTFNFPMAKVKFIPVKTGTNKVVKGYNLRLKAMGGEEFYKKSIVPGKDFVLISPGNYEGELFRKKKVIDIPSIQINEGAKAQKRIDVSI